MVTVGLSTWVNVSKANPIRNRVLVRNVTAAANVYVSLVGGKSGQDISASTSLIMKLIGIDQVEIKNYRGDIFALASAAVADVRTIDE